MIAPSNQIIAVSLKQILSGKGTGMPVAALNWNESVSYQLDNDAKALFCFCPEKQAITLVTEKGGSVLADVTRPTLDRLTVTINPDTGPWTAKATLYFLILSEQQPFSIGLDPDVKNSGGPP